VEGLRAIVKKNDVPSVVSGTIVEGLRAFAKDKLIYSTVTFLSELVPAFNTPF
jgi:hypothetical protein